MIAVLVCAGLVGSCNEQKNQAAAPAPPPPAVGTKKVETKGVSRAYQFVGRITAINKVDLRARVEGFIEKIEFKEGQEVKAGQSLYQLEKSLLTAQVQQAQANLASAQAKLTNAQLTYDRSAALIRNQTVTQATLDLNRANLDGAKADVLQNRAALAQAQVNLGYTDIKAPVDGRIGRTNYTLGNLVNSSSGVLDTIVSQDPMYVMFPVSVSQLLAIRAARKQEDGRLTKIEILLRLSNGKEYPHPGVWNYTAPQVDQNTDTVNMRGTMPNPERMLIDGQFVTVEVKEVKKQPQLVVPQAAVQIDQGGSYVLVVGADHKAEIKRIKTGEQDGTNVVVESGLKEGEAVIVDGVQKVRPGQPVEATSLDAPAESKT